MKRAPLVFVLIAALVAGTRAQAIVTDIDAQAIRVTTFAVQHPEVDDRVVAQMMRALNEGLKRNTRLDMKDLDVRLADFAQEIPQAQIDEGRTLLTDGKKAIAANDFSGAIKKLIQATDTFAKVLPFIKKQELAEAMLALGVAQFSGNEMKAARVSFTRLLTWRSDFKYDVDAYTAKAIPLFEEARKEVERGKRGSLEIRTDPPAAQAYVDGRYVGVTPTYAEGLSVGEHYVTIKRDGYRKAVMPGVVSDRAQQLVTVSLTRSTKYILVEQSLKQIDKDVGQVKLPGAADNLREVLFIDQGVFLRAAKASNTEITVDTFLYELRGRRRLKTVSRTILIGENAPSIDKQMANLASTLYTNVDYTAELEAPKDAPPPMAKKRKPFYKTWWFWTVVGVAAAGVAVTAVFARPPESCGNNFCPQFTP